MPTGGALTYLHTLLTMAVSRKRTQRAAIIMCRWKLRVLAIPFFRILPDLYTLNGNKMFPGNENLDKLVFLVKIWDLKKKTFFPRFSSMPCYY